MALKNEENNAKMAKSEESDVPKACGHVNKQYINMQGVLEDLQCELKDGHAGNHRAKYEALREFNGLKNPAYVYKIWMGKEYQVVEDIGEWGDAAARTAREIAVELEDKRAKLQAFVDANPGMNEAHKQKARDLGLVPALRA